MERLTEKAVGCFEYALKNHKAVPGEFGTYEAFFDYSMAVKRLGHYEDTGLEPEEIKNALDVNDIIPEINVTVDRIRELINAEQAGRLVVLDEKIALSMCAGARAIENNKRLFGVTYSYDIFGVHGGPKEISYFEAAKKLREIAELFLKREEAEAALAGKGGDS